jgi:hypothetical protein
VEGTAARSAQGVDKPLPGLPASRLFGYFQRNKNGSRSVYLSVNRQDMAHPNLPLIQALRTTAQRLREGAHYAWGHHGSCNCGNLLQVLTRLTKEEILRHARTGLGEWTELAEEHCSVTGAPVDLMISKLMETGLTTSDIHNLEYLEDKDVLNALPGGFRWLRRNQREDVILYFETFADLLEQQLLQKIRLPEDLLAVREPVTA